MTKDVLSLTVVAEAVGHSFRLDGFSRINARDLVNSGTISSQSVEALLLLAILIELQKMNEPEAM